jgi:hypothetical protein
VRVAGGAASYHRESVRFVGSWSGPRDAAHGARRRVAGNADVSSLSVVE